MTMKSRKLSPGPPWHVVHVIGSLRTGGAEKMLANLMEAVDRQEFRHTVLCLASEGEIRFQLFIFRVAAEGARKNLLQNRADVPQSTFCGIDFT